MKVPEALFRHLKANVGIPFEGVIAGGYARDQILGVQPRDIDVFFLDCGTDGVGHAKIADLLDRWDIPYDIEAKEYQAVTDQDIPLFEPRIDITWMRTWKVQLICTPCKTVQEIVDTFDYNVCRFYIDPTSDWTAKAVFDQDFESLMLGFMALQHTRTPWSSLRRGILMADRFKFQFSDYDKSRLIEAIYKEQNS